MCIRDRINWILERSPIVGGLFLNHGENDSREALKQILSEKGIPAEKVLIPHFDESFELQAAQASSKGRNQNTRSQEEIQSYDWNNQYAAFSLDLINKLEAASSSKERSEILSIVHRALSEQ